MSNDGASASVVPITGAPRWCLALAERASEPLNRCDALVRGGRVPRSALVALVCAGGVPPSLVCELSGPTLARFTTPCGVLGLYVPVGEACRAVRSLGGRVPPEMGGCFCGRFAAIVAAALDAGSGPDAFMPAAAYDAARGELVLFALSVTVLPADDAPRPSAPGGSA